MISSHEMYFTKAVSELTSRLEDLEERVEPLALPEDDSILQELESAMGHALEACNHLDRETEHDSQLLKALQTRFREETAPWCDQSWIIRRARTKPRGFPGDYQMLSAIYDGVPISRGIGGYLDRMCLKMDLGRAVNSRLRDARQFLQTELAERNDDVSILNVASGPGREYRGFSSGTQSREILVKCVDSDEGALKYVSRHVRQETADNIDFECISHNAMRMRSEKAVVEKFGRNDIIYSVGLADYIPDRLLIPMLNAWRESLNAGGVLYVGFKDCHRYNKVEYQWLMDWHFLQRDERDCLELLEKAGFDLDLVDSSRDETGIILQYTYRTRNLSRIRVDQAQPEILMHSANQVKVAD